MRIYTFLAVLLLGICCAVFFVFFSGKRTQTKRSVDPDTLRLMQKTQAELTVCVERCKSAAAESKDREILFALANSQQILADRHEAIINILLKKYKMDRISTSAYSIEMDPRTLVLPPIDEYRTLLSNANQEKSFREVLIALEVTNKVLESDGKIAKMIDTDAEEGLDADFSLCPVCGQLFMQEPEGNCPVCHSDKERFLKLINGEIPPREEGTFVTVSD